MIGVLQVWPNDSLFIYGVVKTAKLPIGRVFVRQATFRKTGDGYCRLDTTFPAGDGYDSEQTFMHWPRLSNYQSTIVFNMLTPYVSFYGKIWCTLQLLYHELLQLSKT